MATAFISIYNEILYIWIEKCSRFSSRRTANFTRIWTVCLSVSFLLIFLLFEYFLIFRNISVDTKRTITKWKSDTIQYTEQSFYHFDHNHSLPLDTELTVLNYPLLSALYMVKSMMKKKSILGFLTPVVQNVVSNVIQSSGEKIIEQRQAADLLDGHRVKFFKNVQRLLKPMKALGIKFGPELENFDFEHYSFGFGPQNSGQKSELYEHFRHTENGHLFDGIYKVGGKRKLKDFRPPCNEMSGSSGIFFGMHLTAPEISFFSHSVCRKIRLIKK